MDRLNGQPILGIERTESDATYNHLDFYRIASMAPIMNPETAQQAVRSRVGDLSDSQFHQLMKLVFEEIEETSRVELRPPSDDDIHLRVVVEQPLFRIQLGVTVIHRPDGSPVDETEINNFAKEISASDLQGGTVVSSADYSEDARSAGSTQSLKLIDMATLSDLMVENHIGVTSDGAEEYSLHEDLWELFEGPVRETTIPSKEVPQADNFENLQTVLRAVDRGHDLKEEIAEFVESQTGGSFDPRQADYYCVAAWLLGFLHKHRSSRRWGLTSEGREYLEFVYQGREGEAERKLHEAIREVEIIRRIYDEIENTGSIERDRIETVLARETELSGTTTGRRSQTVKKWLAELPEIRLVSGESGSRFEFN